ncbi:hypothetical protein IW140_000878 [Coemansia sp. RSA 1813]|nr:Dolichyl-diphosphooligosaccharide-protein glycosyltransferase subunit dad1 [Coemansia sp. RSA 1646]KAJ2217227.1 hypothetical protein EV179_000694 [Coemansia sp. RSA 487]KAJ2572427.1 hypothetical protein IW140_000878 [Coemansia sp. RSA 1813]
MDRTESLTANYGNRSQFEREKERLIVEINQGMDTVNRNLIQLNQNLESAISLSANFGRISSLWSEFGMIINPPAEENDAGTQHSECEEEYNEHDARDDEADGQGVVADPEDGNASESDTVMDEDL